MDNLLYSLSDVNLLHSLTGVGTYGRLESVCVTSLKIVDNIGLETS